MIPFPYKLYLVISEADCKGKNVIRVAGQAIKGGVDIIQLREKNASVVEFTTKTLQLKELTDQYRIPLIINDNLMVAEHVNAAGIHVGNNDLPPVDIRREWNAANKIIGYSIEYIEQLQNEQVKAADYLGISPVFGTVTKTDTVTEWGLEGITTIRQLTAKPLVAIGNMQLNNVKAVIGAGADCIAVVSAICSADNPEKAAYDLKNEMLK
jgi:thiamine-phosphate pyrophosphorylase